MIDMNSIELMYAARMEYISNIRETINVALEENEIELNEVEDFIRWNFTDLTETEIQIILSNY